MFGPSRWPDNMKKRIIIVGNGTLQDTALKDIQTADYVMGVDRGAYRLIQRGRVPDLAIGDFDSISKQELSIIMSSSKEVKKFPIHKDWTDMELAIREAILHQPSEVVIFGGTGTRLDHTVATWQALDMLLTAKIPHVLLDETNRVRLVGIGRTILINRGEHKYISILPYSGAVTLTLSGFRYDLPKTTLKCGTTRGVSNEIAGRQGVITLLAGKAWVIESND